MSTIDVNQVSFSYGGSGLTLFDEVSLNIQTEWKLGLIGRNGRGKTTFFNLLQNKLPYSGQITHQEEFVYFPQYVSDETKYTYDIIDELNQCELWEVEKELSLLGLESDVLWRPYSSLSGGEKTKVLLAMLFADTDRFPLIDEPTNHLDMEARQQVADYLKQKRTGFIVISHDRIFIDEVCDHIMSIDKSKIEIIQGNYSSYQFQKDRQDSTEKAQNSKLQKEVSRLKETATKKSQWSTSREGDKYGKSHVKNSGSVGGTGFIGARAAKVMKKSKVLERRMASEIEEKEQLLKNIEFIDPLTMNIQETHHKTFLRLEDVSLSFDGEALFNPVTFEIEKGDRVVLKGGNGSGKTSLIKAILNQFEGEMTGEMTAFDEENWSLVRQNYAQNTGTITDFCKKHDLDREMFLSNLRKLGMERELFNNKIEHLSMGQRKKVELAKSLTQASSFYLWDEPLNYLDLFNYEQLEEVILEKNPTMLIVEHDQLFVDKIATKIIELS